MEDWDQVPRFGACVPWRGPVLRPSAYGLVGDEGERPAVVRTPSGVYLPGGGIEPGETPGEAIEREILEECGLVVGVGLWRTRAVQFVYSEAESTPFEKHCIFIECTVHAPSVGGSEADHELLWVDPGRAPGLLAHPSQGWAVERWRTARFVEGPG